MSAARMTWRTAELIAATSKPPPCPFDLTHGPLNIQLHRVGNCNREPSFPRERTNWNYQAESGPHLRYRCLVDGCDHQEIVPVLPPPVTPRPAREPGDDFEDLRGDDR